MAGAEKKIGSRTAGLRLLSLIAVFAPAPAAAGAWVAPEGGQWITSTVLGQRDDETFYSEASLYYETPVQPNTSLVFAPWVEHEVIDGWRAEATLGAKHALYRSEENVLAIQAGAL